MFTLIYTQASPKMYNMRQHLLEGPHDGRRDTYRWPGLVGLAFEDTQASWAGLWLRGLIQECSCPQVSTSPLASCGPAEPPSLGKNISKLDSEGQGVWTLGGQLWPPLGSSSTCSRGLSSTSPHLKCWFQSRGAPQAPAQLFLGGPETPRVTLAKLGSQTGCMVRRLLGPESEPKWPHPAGARFIHLTLQHHHFQLEDAGWYPRAPRHGRHCIWALGGSGSTLGGGPFCSFCL